MKNNYVVFVDSDEDMTPEICKEYGLHLISMPYSDDQGHEIFPYESFETFDYKAFYDELRKGHMMKTSALSIPKYIEYFEPFFKEGKDIVYIHFSRKMSMTFDVLDLAMAELKEKYPERTIHLFDTKAIVTLAYKICIEMAKLYKAGASIEELQAWYDKEVDHYAVRLFANDLTYFRRSGRVKGFPAVMGNLLGIRPIIYMGEDGVMTSIGKVKGLLATFQYLINEIKNLGDEVKEHGIAIGHTDAEENAHKLMELIRKEFGEDIKIEEIITNPTAGSHCGPGGVAVVFHSKHR